MQEKKLVMSSNMSISDNRRYSPELCFPGFDGEWVVKKLGEIADSIVVGFPFKGNDLTDDNSGTLILRGMSIGDGVIKHGGEYDKYYLGDISALQKYILHKDDIVMGMDGSIGRNIALVGEKEHNSLLIQRVARIRVKNIPLHIVYQQITSQRFKVYVASEKVGAVIAHISQKQIEEFPIFVPTLPEQQMIAECLSSLDDVIAAESDRLIALKNHKKGLMQQLFPQKGETTPKLRFPGFDGEWNWVFGNELFEAISNKRHNSDLPILALTQDQGAIPREMINYNVQVSEKSVEGYKVVEIDDFIISLRSFEGGIEYSRYKGLCSPAYIILRKTKSDLDSDFYRIYFKSYDYIQQLNKNLEGIRDGKMISYKQFSEIKLPVPSFPEQQKIADCLSALDDQISAQQQKVEALKEHKRGLMQKLFPTIK